MDIDFIVQLIPVTNTGGGEGDFNPRYERHIEDARLKE